MIGLWIFNLLSLLYGAAYIVHSIRRRRLKTAGITAFLAAGTELLFYAYLRSVWD